MTRTRNALLLLTGTLVLAGCGPMSLERAEQVCRDKARLAERPRGEAYVGASNSGAVSGFEIEISSDFIQGRDPSQVYDSCVYQKSGKLPSRPYVTGVGR